MTLLTMGRSARLGMAVFALGLFLAVVGCGAARAGRGAPNVITREQIAVLPDYSAYDIIQRLQPRWLRSQTANFAGPITPAIYVDELPGSLRGIRSLHIERIEYMNARDATTRYGTGFMGGLIRVVTRPFR